MTFSMRRMRKEDIAQVTEVDREAFPTQLPPPNYYRELQNELARYIVACDKTKTVEAPRVKPEKGLYKLLSRVRWWSNHNRIFGNEAPAAVTQYIVGFAGIWVLADEAHITNIAVRERYQRQGIGEALLISIIGLAKELKADIMTLEVRASNTQAQNLYRKYGFTQVGRRRGYYTDNHEDGILMSTESITSATFQANLQQLKQSLSRKTGTANYQLARNHSTQPDKR